MEGWNGPFHLSSSVYSIAQVAISIHCSVGVPGSLQRKFKPPTPEQFLLACCLRKGGMGKQCPVEAATLRNAALSLPSLKMLDARVACFRCPHFAISPL